MKRAAWALISVAAGLWPSLVRPPSTAFRDRLGRAVALGTDARFAGLARGPAAPDGAQMRLLAREADARLAIARTTVNLADAALVHVAADRPDQAIDLLEEAAGLSPRDAKVATDLAAAYLVRGRAKGTPRDFARALQRADESLASRPSHEARFDRAQALEALGLTGSARSAWRAYLERDGSSLWSADAARHLDALGPAAAPSIDVPGRLHDAVPQPAALRALVRSHPIQARALVEDSELTAWADASIQDDAPRAAAPLANARAMGQAIEDVLGDALLADAVRAIDAASPELRRTLAEGHAAYGEALALVKREAWPAAAVRFAEAQERLARSRSPFAIAAQLQVGVCEYYRPDYPRALAAFAAARPDGRRYPLLQARALWLSGLVRFVTGRPFEALRDQQQARDLFARAGEEGHAAFLDSLAAADLQALGRAEAAWDARARAVRGLDQVGDPRRVFSILWEVARVLLDEDQAWAAGEFLGETDHRLDLELDPSLRAATLVRQARIAERVGAYSLATQQASEARRLIASLEPARTRRLAADLAVTEGEIAAASEPTAAVAVFTRALDFLAGAGNEVQTATLLRRRARASRAISAFAPAEKDLRAVLDAYDTGRSSLRDEGQRIAYFEQVRAAADELIALQVDVGRPWDALQTAERTRARSLRDRAAGEPGFDLARVKAELPADVAIVSYSVLDDRLIAWVVRRDAAEVVARPLTLQRLWGLVSRSRRHVAMADDHANDSLAELHRVLVQPLEGQLRGARTVVFVPDKCLQAVPFAALLDARSRRHLIEDVAIASAPSVATVGSAAWDVPIAPARVLAVVNDAADSPSEEWPVLPAAAGEARQVVGLYPQGALLEGTDATPARVLEELPDADVIHVAAHAVTGDHGGLVLRASGPDHDPVFRADARLFARGRTRVAVLASCRTAAGVESLEGPLSLARAFLAAGTPAVIAALWDLPDSASAALIPALHRGLAAGASPASALRQAQIEALRSKGPAADLRGWAALDLIVGVASRHPQPRAKPPRPSV